MKCVYCDGTIVLTNEVFHADRSGIHLTIDHLPVYKCEKCSEILLSTNEIKLVQKTLTELEKSLNQKAA